MRDVLMLMLLLLVLLLVVVVVTVKLVRTRIVKGQTQVHALLFQHTQSTSAKAGASGACLCSS